ncbi:MAG: F0F1-type ATP synthase assembly protein I [Patiriisocius sp.]|jgi:F0F1-type ATP synthase assembly protein I
MNFSTGEWIAIIGILVALILGFIQIVKKSNAKSAALNITQTSSSFSKSKQHINVKFDQSNENDG